MSGGEKNKIPVTLDLSEMRVRLEAGAPGRVRLSAWDAHTGEPRPLDLTEQELAALFQRAIRAGIISIDFVKELHAVIDI